MSWIKDLIRNWLQIEPAQSSSIVVQEPYSYEANVFKNQLWYRGDAAELHQFYTQSDDWMNNTNFWAAQATTGINLRKIHSGLPSLIVDVLTDIVISDLLNIKIDNTEGQKRWDEISEDNDFIQTLKSAIKDSLTEGDGAFKISYDAKVSKLPIIEFFSGIRVRYDYNRDRLIGIHYISSKKYNNRNYTLDEYYTKAGILYTMYDSVGSEIPIAQFADLSDLKPLINPSNFLMGAQLMFDKSKKFEGRGQSIYEAKSGKFDALDECISQWIESLRDGRTNKYIPEEMIPQDAVTGRTLYPNSFDNRYIKTQGDATENATNKIEVVAGEIPAEALTSTYCTLLDLCLQGLISPSTLGIDVKKLDNADAQREKEKVTLYTRNKIIGTLQKVIPTLVETVLQTQDMIAERTPAEYKVSVTFGEYANPSFEAQVETLGKAKVAGIMSTERIVEEMYGDTLTEAEKAEEVQRLKDEQGVIQMPLEEPDEDIINQPKHLPDGGQDGKELPDYGALQSAAKQHIRSGA